MDADDLLRWAIGGYYRGPSEGELYQPSRRASGVRTSEAGLTPDGVLRRLRRWPKAIE